MDSLFRSIPFFIVLLFLLGACSTPLKELVYLNGVEAGKSYENGPKPDEYLIRPNDQLYIQVISDDPANAAFLNLMNTQMNRGSISNSSNALELLTFLVDENGYISYPQLGELKVGGCSVLKVQEELQLEVDKYLESASVFVKLVNRTLTVLGEVNHPGQIPMIKNQLTIFEALGSAGGVTDYGNRQQVKVIREFPDGKYVEELDLTDPDLLFSPYYYILPHDIVYIQHNTKVYGAKNLNYVAPISITASILSVGLLILNLVL